MQTFTIKAESNGTGLLTYDVRSNNSGVFTMLNNATGEFQVHVNTTEELDAEYVVTGSNTFEIVYRPNISVCYCGDGGSCIEEKGKVL